MWVKDWERRLMRNFPTSRYNKYKVKYFVDILWRDNKAEYAVIELPTNDIVKVFTFKEDAEEMVQSLMKVRPFGKDTLPKFLKDKV